MQPMVAVLTFEDMKGMYNNLTSKIITGEPMSSLGTTRMSAKGQVVIPEDIRKRLGLAEGAEFIVIGKGNAIVLKAIASPPMDDFAELLEKARSEAKKAGLKPSDIPKLIKKVRREK